MKIKRYKKVHKILRFYANSFGFRKPYQVLIDGTVCFTALKYKINIQEQFPKYLDGEAKLLTTQCIVLEAEKLGPLTFGASVIVKQFPIHQCGHSKSPVTGSECILDMIKDHNSSRYIVATQDRELQQKCRQMEAVPLLYLHMQTPTLEAPSEVSQDTASSKASSQFQVREFEKQRLTLLEGEPSKTGEEPRKKRKRKGGPNPLSCKKKMKKSDNEIAKKKKDINKKRKRKRSRLAKKVKSELKSV